MTTTFRRALHKVYLKQRMTCVLVDEEYQAPEGDGGDASDEESEDDAMWNAMEKADDGPKRKNRPSK